MATALAVAIRPKGSSKAMGMPSDELTRPEAIPGFITKILLPRRRADVLVRPRLVEFLVQHVDRKVLLVCAPAGYGKTTLLVDFANQTGRPICWYTLTPADSDPQVFLEYLVFSVRRRFPAFGERTLRYLRTAGTKDLEAVVGLFVSELHEVTEEQFLIVLDDVHNVDSQPAIQALLNLLISGLPANCCFVLASRVVPRVRLSRLVANREAAGLGASDLRFTAAEIQQLFSRHYKLLIPAALAEELAREAEGWIAGIILTSHSLWQGLFKGMIEAKRSGGPVFDYLATEVFDHQDPDLQSFLLGSSVLPRLNPENCSQLLGRDDTAEVLRLLDESNLFLFRLEGEADWYRYHPIFQEFLQTRLRHDDPSRFADLHHRAGKRAEADGDIDAAIEHYLQAGDAERAAGLLERVAVATIDAGRIRTLLRWCDRLPAALAEGRPQIQIARARAAFDLGEFTLMQAALDAAWTVASAANDQKMIASAQIWRSAYLRLQGHYQDAAATCREGLAIAEAIADDELLAHGYRQLGITLAVGGSSTEAIPALERAVAAYAATGDRYNQGVVWHTLGMSWKRLGDVLRARTALGEAVGHWRAIANEGMLAGTLIVLGNLHYDLGQLDEALRQLGEAQRAARESGYLRLDGYATESMADVQRDRGKFDEAQSAYEQGMTIGERVSDRHLQIISLEGLARAQLYANDLNLAQATVARARHLAGESDSPYERGLCEDTHGVLCLETGRLAEALAAAEQACEWLSAGGAARDLARARLHLALVCLRSGQTDRAVETAVSALNLLPGGADESLLAVEGRLLAEVFAAVGPQGPVWLADVLARFGPLQALPPVPESVATLPVGGAHLVRCYTLGRMDLEVDGRPLAASEWVTQKARELWFFLLAEGPAAREHVVDVLWPDAEAGKGAQVFHTTVHRLRRTLFANCVERQGDLWNIAGSVQVWSDDQEFERLAQAVSRGGDDPANEDRWTAAAQAVSLYRGPYLPSLDTEWAGARRRRLQSGYLRLLRDLIDHARALGQHDEVVGYAQLYLQTDPDEESIHEALMRSLAHQGNRPAALRHYHRYVRQLREELEAQPSRRLRLLSEQLAKEG
jgi:LuxR family maltose regulon positive regulatory protein